MEATAPTEAKPKIWSVIVISWNVRELLARCLASLQKYAPAGTEFFCVDNASVDGSGAVARTDFPEVKLIANQDNAGFARAVNQGTRVSRSEYILLLNPDAAIMDGAMQVMEKFFVAHPNVGIIGGQIQGPRGDIQPSVRGFPTLCVFLLTILKVHNFFAHSLACLKQYFLPNFDYHTAQPTQQVMGAFLAFRRTLWEELGGWDENFFLWYEEVDFCARAIQHGVDIWYLPTARATHAKGKSFAQVSAIKKQAVIQTSMRYYARKHLGFFSWVVVSFLSPVGLLLAGLVQFFQIKKSFKKEQAL